MNETPLISVIVPVYKVEPYLRKCVDSIIGQTYQNLEIILVDDGSPDNCGAICDEYAAKDSRIRVIHKENGGLSSARNAGLDVCTGDYIGFVDSDDWIKPVMYETLYHALEENNADLAICELYSADSESTPISAAPELLNRNQALSKLDWRCNPYGYIFYVSACYKLYHKKLFHTVRFPLGKLHEDQFIAHEVFSLCEKVVKIPDRLYCYFGNTDSITHSRFTVKRFDDMEALCDRCFFYRENGLESHIPEAIATMDHLFCSYMYYFFPKTRNDFKRLHEIRKMMHKARKICNEPIPAKQKVQRLVPRLYMLAAILKVKIRKQFST